MLSQQNEITSDEVINELQTSAQADALFFKDRIWEMSKRVIKGDKQIETGPSLIVEGDQKGWTIPGGTRVVANEAKFEQVQKNFVRGNMPMARWVGLTFIEEITDMLETVTAYGGRDVEHAVRRIDNNSIFMAQFALPTSVIAYSPWARLSHLMLPHVRAHFNFDMFATLATVFEPPTPRHHEGKLYWVSEAIRPIRTNLITFVYLKDIDQVEWFVGDYPNFNPGVGLDGWVNCISKTTLANKV